MDFESAQLQMSNKRDIMHLWRAVFLIYDEAEMQ